MAGELIDLLARSHGDVLAGLKGKHGEGFSRGGPSDDVDDLAGEEESVPGASPSLDAELALLRAAIGPVRDDLTGLLQSVLVQMKRARSVRFLGGVLATLAGLVLAVSTAMGWGGTWDKVVSAGFATIGGLTALLADHFEQAPSGLRIASAEEHGKLSQMLVELVRIERRVSRSEVYPLGGEEIKTTLDSLDQFAANIARLKHS